MSKRILYTPESPQLLQAYEQAVATFKYCWRELSWEQRRIVPALDFAAVKLAFCQEEQVEHMWITDLAFDGFRVQGSLMNQPDLLTNVKLGDPVDVPLPEIEDWMFSIAGRAYGGFTIQVMRAEMTPKQRKKHDKMWGLEFGDPDDVLLVYQQKEHPDYLVEHPMSQNAEESFKQFLSEHPNEVSETDAAGYTMLHRETIAGNRTIVEVLLQAGADKQARLPSGQTPADLAQALHWDHLISLLS